MGNFAKVSDSIVSTHSRLKAAGFNGSGGGGSLSKFQHTAA